MTQMESDSRPDKMISKQYKNLLVISWLSKLIREASNTGRDVVYKGKKRQYNRDWFMRSYSNRVEGENFWIYKCEYNGEVIAELKVFHNSKQFGYFQPLPDITVLPECMLDEYGEKIQKIKMSTREYREKKYSFKKERSQAAKNRDPKNQWWNKIKTGKRVGRPKKSAEDSVGAES